jgi:hypothetical protein
MSKDLCRSEFDWKWNDAAMTQQSPDTLIYKDEKWDLLREPLDAYLAVKEIELTYASTDLMRGYDATWEIVDDRLYLTEIDQCYRRSNPEVFDESTKLTLADIFPDCSPPILVNWFSGKLVVGNGELLEGTIAGYGEPYENMLNIYLERGRVTMISPNRGSDQ